MKLNKLKRRQGKLSIFIGQEKENDLHTSMILDQVRKRIKVKFGAFLIEWFVWLIFNYRKTKKTSGGLNTQSNMALFYNFKMYLKSIFT